MQQIRQVVAGEFEAVNALIVEQLHSDVPLVENIGHYIVAAGGKRLRPMLTLLSAGACGDIQPNHIQLAAVIEFIHTATLLHDDVVDLSALRRGLPTANAKWGDAPSILVGDFLYSRAFQMLVSIGSMPVMALLSDTTNTVAEGEVLQLTRAGDPDTGEDAYYQVIRNKTAVLFAAACSGSALLAGREELAAPLHDYGLNLGTAFQLVDDLLDYRGDPAETGKNVGDDLAEGKPTLPLIYALQHAAADERELIANAIRNKSAEQLQTVIAIVQRCGALDYTEEAARRYSEDALATLDALPEGCHREALAELTRLALQRVS